MVVAVVVVVVIVIVIVLVVLFTMHDDMRSASEEKLWVSGVFLFSHRGFYSGGRLQAGTRMGKENSLT